MPHGIASEEQSSKSEDQAATQQNNGGSSIEDVSQSGTGRNQYPFFCIHSAIAKFPLMIMSYLLQVLST